MARTPSVKTTDFLPVYFAGCKEGLTSEQIARKLGMKLPSFRSKASALRGEYAKKGIELPTPADSGTAGRKSNKAEVDALVAALMAEHSADDSDTDNGEENADVSGEENADVSGEENADVSDDIETDTENE